jgi:hypothetical protein
MTDLGNFILDQTDRLTGSGEAYVKLPQKNGH